MEIKIELTETDLKNLVIKHLEENILNCSMDEKFLTILVKSKQNFKSEWEPAQYKAIYNKI